MQEQEVSRKNLVYRCDLKRNQHQKSSTKLRLCQVPGRENCSCYQQVSELSIYVNTYTLETWYGRKILFSSDKNSTQKLKIVYKSDNCLLGSTATGI